MDSRCLSAAGLRFLGLRFPLGSSALLTSGLPADRRTATGFPRSARKRYDRGGCHLYSGAVVSARDLISWSRPMAQYRRISHLQATTSINGASTMVQVSSSVRSSPSPARPYGSAWPWTFPLAQRRSVTRQPFGAGTSMDTNSDQGSSPDHSYRATACRTEWNAFHSGDHHCTQRADRPCTKDTMSPFSPKYHKRTRHKNRACDPDGGSYPDVSDGAE